MCRGAMETIRERFANERNEKMFVKLSGNGFLSAMPLDRLGCKKVLAAGRIFEGT